MKHLLSNAENTGAENAYIDESERLGNSVSEPQVTYTNLSSGEAGVYINPFDDWVFKRIFASEAHKEVILAFLNEVLKGKRRIQSITYGKNEYPGEIEEEAGSVFDFTCTDFDGTSFLVEVQRQKQRYFKERSLFYAGRLISDQAPKGDRTWKYNLKEVYSISLLENFCLQDADTDDYMHNVCLCNAKTGEPFYSKLHFIYIEMLKFSKTEAELISALDQWLYALKHASEMKYQPKFLNAPELTTFFELANYANLTLEERDMYRTAQQRAWDQQNVIDYEREEGFEKGREEGIEKGQHNKAKEIALDMRKKGLEIEFIAEITKLSVEEITALRYID